MSESEQYNLVVEIGLGKDTRIFRMPPLSVRTGRKLTRAFAGALLVMSEQRFHGAQVTGSIDFLSNHQFLAEIPINRPVVINPSGVFPIYLTPARVLVSGPTWAEPGTPVFQWLNQYPVGFQGIDDRPVWAGDILEILRT